MGALLESEESGGAKGIVEDRVVVFPEGVEVLTEGPTQQFGLSHDDVSVSCLRSGPLLVAYRLRNDSDVRA